MNVEKIKSFFEKEFDFKMFESKPSAEKPFRIKAFDEFTYNVEISAGHHGVMALELKSHSSYLLPMLKFLFVVCDEMKLDLDTDAYLAENSVLIKNEIKAYGEYDLDCQLFVHKMTENESKTSNKKYVFLLQLTTRLNRTAVI